MQYVQLGKTDLTVSRICFGCWQLSPRFWGEIPLKPWEQALRKALDLGVNFIDTANAYGDGYAEECLGKFLAAEKLRDRFIIATKFYWNFRGEERFPDTRHASILQECEDSLRRLKIDCIDLYQVHAWDPLTRPDEVAAALRQLKQQGKVRWIGVSNFNVEQMNAYLKELDVECLQPQYSLLRRTVEARELPFCLEKRIGVIPFSPLFRGLLTGKYAPDHVFTDDRANHPFFKGKAFRCILGALEELKPTAERHGLTLAQLAIRWVLTQPAVSSAIVGIKTPDHVETIVQAADDLLPNSDWHKIGDIMTRAREEAEAVSE